MKKRKFPLLLVLGAGLILISLSMLIAYQIDRIQGEQYCQRIASKIDSLLPEKTVGIPGTYPKSCMPVLEVESADYAALLEIPAYGLSLPVADKWDSNNLSQSPARFFGSAYDNTLIIGGIDSPQQFGFCKEIELGAYVTITDMTGHQFTYTVSKVERSDHAETSWLTDHESALTLFCHDIYAMEYIAVRCILSSGS